MVDQEIWICELLARPARKSDSNLTNRLKDDPKFDLIRKLINNFPPEKLINLKKYIKDLEKS